MGEKQPVRTLACNQKWKVIHIYERNQALRKNIRCDE